MAVHLLVNGIQLGLQAMQLGLQHGDFPLPALSQGLLHRPFLLSCANLHRAAFCVLGFLGHLFSTDTT